MEIESDGSFVDDALSFRVELEQDNDFLNANLRVSSIETFQSSLLDLLLQNIVLSRPIGPASEYRMCLLFEVLSSAEA